jgi:hypothetical protein
MAKGGMVPQKGFPILGGELRGFLKKQKEGGDAKSR